MVLERLDRRIPGGLLGFVGERGAWTGLAVPCAAHPGHPEEGRRIPPTGLLQQSPAQVVFSFGGG